MKMIKLRGINCLYAFVDDSEYDYLNSFKWFPNYSSRIVYAKRHIKASERTDDSNVNSFILMHRSFFQGITPNEVIDHKDTNGLNNQKSNLRKCTKSQNGFNIKKGRGKTSGFKGVYLTSKKTPWVAYIKQDGKKKHIGVFDTEIEAASAYNSMALKLHGEFARLNVL